jgi:uncharacterized membrane protein
MVWRHGLPFAIAGWLLRFRVQEMLVCSNAIAGGPTTSAAMDGALSSMGDPVHLHWKRPPNWLK